MRSVKLFLALVAISICASGYCQLSYPITATGQRQSYNQAGEVITLPEVGDALYGQDANYLSGAEMSFTDNVDGTVTDLNTGLMWQQVPASEGMTWAQAKEYCENLELGGYSDWRMPTLKELFSISNFERGWPYIDTQFFKLANGVSKDEQYWADNKYVGVTVEGRDDAAFGVNHVTGHIKAYPAGSSMRSGDRDQSSSGERTRGERRERSSSAGQRPTRPQGGDSLQRPAMPQGGDSLRRPAMQASNRPGGSTTPPPSQGGSGGQNGRPMGNPMAKQVRAVRGDIYGENNFVDNGNGTISDLATGLMWSKDDNGSGVEWIEALPYAESSTLAGYSDWRLPNIKELQSIVDYSRAPRDGVLEAAIDPIFNSTPFVNEAGDDDFGYYWSSTSACFTRGKPYYFAWYVALGRAVNSKGADFHGAGAVRFDSKSDNGMAVEGGEERYYNFVRLVRNIPQKQITL